jgi:tetratricopeptide (TPR) repeat protein
LAQDSQNRTALAAVGVLGGYRAEWQGMGITALNTLLTLEPNHQSARAQRALLLGYQGRFAESFADYEIALKKPTPQVLLEAAKVYSYSGDFAQSLALFQRYQQQGKPLPDDYALVAYAAALRGTGQASMAAKLLSDRLIQVVAKRGSQPPSPIEIDVRTGLAVAQQANGQLEQGLATLAPLRNLPTATLPLARALSEMGRKAGNTALSEEAIALYRQALQQPSGSPGLLAEVANVFSEQPATRAEALQIYQRLTAQQPNAFNLLVKQLVLERQLNTISAAEQTQRLQAALQPLPDGTAERQILAQSLVNIDPPNPQLLPIYQELGRSPTAPPLLTFRIAQMLLQTGDLSGAKQALQAYRTASPQDFGADLLLADLERRENNLEGSAQRYQALIERAASEEIRKSALQGLAGIRQGQGRITEALQAYDQILAIAPQDWSARFGKASLAYQSQRLTEAEADRLIADWQQTQTVPPAGLYSLVGALPVAAKREQLYSQLLAVEPNNLAMQKRQIQVLALRDRPAAQQRIDQLRQAFPDDTNTRFAIGELAQSVGNLTLASQAYETILREQPTNPDALAALGGVRFQQGRYSEAETIYTQVLALRPSDWDVQRILAELSLAQDQPFTALERLQKARQMQVAQDVPDTDLKLSDRIVKLKVDRLKRRGFQPAWERY